MSNLCLDLETDFSHKQCDGFSKNKNLYTHGISAKICQEYLAA